ncbi:MAG: DUF1801 domain-containing protein [Chloroflexi bacterium]|nr:DUF1801 domain-containing protein [Chloroflexota bacterium]MBP8056083.1 DUF1801 domain-containing protein [Chloroflexota bacterium]
MSELKTKVNDASVLEFLHNVPDEKKRQDSLALLAFMEEVTGYEAKMWGPSIVGFGQYHYKYASGREGDMPLTGFSPRKQALTLYITSGFDQYEELLASLGKHSTGKACLYIKRLADVNLATLRKLVQQSVEHTRKTNQ